MANTDLIQRFRALEQERDKFTSQLNEMQGRKISLEERKAAILAELAPRGIITVEDLSKEIGRIQNDLVNRVTVMEQRIAAIS